MLLRISIPISIMFFFALAFLSGTSCLLLFKTLPALLWPLLSLIFCLGLFFFIPARFKYGLLLICAALGGIVWSVFIAERLLELRLPAYFYAKPVIVTGTIVGLPENKRNQVSFILQTQSIIGEGIKYKRPVKLRLSWYFARHTLRSGERWRLKVRLKAPRNFSNAGDFDYAKWLFAQHISATAYVQEAKENVLLSPQPVSYFIDHMREAIAVQIQKSLYPKPLVGLIQALAVGVRSHIDEAQWRVMRGTGTNHLFAIAGLHIGFVTGFVFFLVSFIWRRAGRLPLYVPTPIAAVIAALLTAIFYSALAGFSLPTRRAVIMTSVFLLATLSRRKIPLWHAWSLALILVLIDDPLSVLSESFWMSFSAVAFIIYGISGRLYRKNIWRHLFYPQWVISVGLIPISLLFFQQYAWLSFLANAIAIPWIGFLVLPLSLLGSLLYAAAPHLSQLLLIGAEYLLELIWPALTWLSQLQNLQWNVAIKNPFVFIFAMVDVLLLLLPRGIPGRSLGILWLLPLLFWQPAAPKKGEVWLTVFDVKPGLAVLVRTPTQALLYESTLKPYINKSMMVPFLQANHIKQLNALILNLSGQGSTNNLMLMDLIPVKQVLLNKRLTNISGNVLQCNTAPQWRWDDLDMRIIVGANNASSKRTMNCGLLLQKNNFAVLIVDGADLNKFDSDQYNILITSFKKNDTTLARLINAPTPNLLILSGPPILNIAERSGSKMIYTTAGAGSVRVIWPADSRKIRVGQLISTKHFWQ